MKKIKIQFPGLQELSQFQTQVEATYLEINLKQLTIIFDCTEAITATVITQFGGKVISIEHTPNVNTEIDF